MLMVNLIFFIVTVVPMYHGEVLPQKPSKQSRFFENSVIDIIFELDYICCFLQKVGNIVNVISKEGQR